MAEPTISAIATALQPWVRGILSGSYSLADVAAKVSAKLGQTVSVKDVVDALKLLKSGNYPYAESALLRARATMKAAEEAASQAARAAAKKGMERSAIELAKAKAREEVLGQAASGGARAAGRSVAGRAATFLGLSAGAWLALGIGVVVLGVGGYIWSRGDAPVEPGPHLTREDCPEPVMAMRKCPWSPDGYAVHECTPGFCFDAGPQGSLACKQEKTVANAHRTYTNDLICDDGFTSVRDVCTNVITSCNPA